MLKKIVPVVAMSSILLVGCNMHRTNVPANNETPMQEVREGVDRGVNRVVPEPGVNTQTPVNNRGMNDHLNNNNNNLNNGLNNNLNQNVVPNAENKWIKEPNVRGQ